MSVGVWSAKHPTGVTTRAIDFAARLATGETLTGTPTATVTVVDGPTASPMTASLPVVDGTKIRVRLSGGELGARYEVFLQCSTTAGLTVEDCAEIQVEDC